MTDELPTHCIGCGAELHLSPGEPIRELREMDGRFTYHQGKWAVHECAEDTDDLSDDGTYPPAPTNR